MTKLDWSRQELRLQDERAQRASKSVGPAPSRGNYPATDKQRAYIKTLAKRKGVQAAPVGTRFQAAAEIERLKHLPKKQAPEATA